MPVEVKHQSFSDCEALDIQGVGVRQVRGNHMNTVRLKFDNLYNLKEFQNELNNLFPENVTVYEKYKEPKNEGYYLSQTGILLLKDEWGWSVIRFQDESSPYLAYSMPNLRLINERHWHNVIKQLTKVAFPLTRVKISPFSE